MAARRIFAGAIPILPLAIAGLVACGKEAPEKRYKDDPALAAKIKARKAAEQAAKEAPPQPYADVAVTERPAGRILYNSHRGRVTSIWGVTIGGQPERKWIFRTPRWSPDGKRVLISYHGDETNRFELGTVPADGGEVVDVATSRDHDSVLGNWSPDGGRIVYVQRTNNKGDIAIIGADGTGARVIAPHAEDDTEPTWSPDGATIAFASYRDGGSAIYTVPAAGGEATRITGEPHGCGQPAYSPDGAYLAYVVTYRHPSTRSWVRDLRVVELDGGGQRTLAKAMKQIVGVDWSPGGHWLVFGCEDDAQSDLCLVDVNGNGLDKITDDPHGDSSPSWRRDALR